MPKILIADDHPLFRSALQIAVEAAAAAPAADASDGRPPLVLEAGSVAEVERLAAGEPGLDLLLLDLRMPGMEGFAGLIGLRRRFPDLPVVIVSAAEEPGLVREAMACGARGYIAKSLGREAMAEALARVLRGGTYVPPGTEGTAAAEAANGAAGPARSERLTSLTPQQLKVLRLLVDGKPNKIIAYELDIAETTVKAHITIILRKLGVHSRTQAVLFARDLLGEAGGR